MIDLRSQLHAQLTRALDPVDDAWPSLEIPEDEPDKDLIPGQRLRPAAVLMPLVERASGWQVLLTHRTDHLAHHGGQISFPGGRLEDQDATPVAGALRETQEEIGVGSELIEIIGSLPARPTITGFSVVPVVATVSPEYQLALDPSEVQSAFEVPLEFVLDPINQQRHSGVFRGRLRYYYVIQYRQHRIWGATAQMLIDLMGRLREN